MTILTPQQFEDAGGTGDWRALNAGADAWFAGAPRRIVIVTMDLIGIDLGEAQAGVGDMVELMGPHALIDDLARAAGTVAHECLTRLNPRGPRIYLGEA